MTGHVPRRMPLIQGDGQDGQNTVPQLSPQIMFPKALYQQESPEGSCRLPVGDGEGAVPLGGVQDSQVGHLQGAAVGAAPSAAVQGRGGLALSSRQPSEKRP